jgi:hypothetical protein
MTPSTNDSSQLFFETRTNYLKNNLQNRSRSQINGNSFKKSHSSDSYLRIKMINNSIECEVFSSFINKSKWTQKDNYTMIIKMITAPLQRLSKKFKMRKRLCKLIKKTVNGNLIIF